MACPTFARPHWRTLVKDKTHAAYQRGDLFEKRAKLMQAWAKYQVLRAATSDTQKSRTPPSGRARCAAMGLAASLSRRLQDGDAGAQRTGARHAMRVRSHHWPDLDFSHLSHSSNADFVNTNQ